MQPFRDMPPQINADALPSAVLVFHGERGCHSRGDDELTVGLLYCRLCGARHRNGSHAEPHEHNQDARKAAMAIDFGVQPAVPHKSGLRAIGYIPDAEVSGSVAAAAIHLAEIGHEISLSGKPSGQHHSVRNYCLASQLYPPAITVTLIAMPG